MNLVIFDIDGTLTDTNQVDEHAIVQALQDVVGATELSTDWNEYINSTDSGIVSEVITRQTGRMESAVLQQVQDEFFEYLEAFYTTSPDLFRAFPNASRIMTDIRSQGIATAIATGSWRESALFKLRVAGIHHDRIPMATADDSVDRSEIIQRAIMSAKHSYNVDEFAEVMFVGDAVWDARASSKLGITFVGVAHNTSADTLLSEGAVAVVKDLSEIFELLKQTTV